MFACAATDDFFRSRIDHMIDLRHPLAVLASRMPWQEIEARVAQVFSRKGHTGVAMPNLDLFGEQVQRTAVPSNAGRPRVPLRIMIALLYLKHAFNESDEGVVERLCETPAWQFFLGQAYFEHHRPCDATTVVKFRQLLGEDGVEELLAQTINVAVELQLIKPQELARVIVDSTVQHKAIAHPTDSRLLETARSKLVDAARDAGIDLKQTFAKEGKELGHKAGLRPCPPVQAHEACHQAPAHHRRSPAARDRAQGRAVEQAVREALAQVLSKAARIVAQIGQHKLCSFHAPEVNCISKGKAKTPYEFGVKVGIDSTLKGNLIVGARAFHCNPYDGHTLREQLEQATIQMQHSAAKPEAAFVDLGYRGWMPTYPACTSCTGARPNGSASRTESCSNGARRSSRSFAT